MIFQKTHKQKQAGRYLYSPMDILGTGAWGTVFKARCLDSHPSCLFALKKINRFKIDGDEASFEKYKNEVMSLQKSNQIKHVVKFADFFKSQSSYYIVTEYKEGSQDLYQYMQSNSNKFTQLQARNIWYSLLKGIDEIHGLKIVHRDLKLQNIVYLPEMKDVRIIDFGLAVQFNQATGKVGSIPFMSPQVIKGQNYTEKTDIWSLGIIFYWMICKKSPYGDNPTVARILQVIKELDSNKKLKVPAGIYMSKNCQDVIKSCLKIQQNQRKCIKEILSMKFFETDPIEDTQYILSYYQPQLAFVN